MYVDDVYDAQIEKVKEQLETLTVGTEEYSRAVDDLNKLVSARDARKTAYEEKRDKDYEVVLENEREAKELKREKREFGLRVASVVAQFFNAIGSIGGSCLDSFTRNKEIKLKKEGLDLTEKLYNKEFDLGNPTSQTLKNLSRNSTPKLF